MIVNPDKFKSIILTKNKSDDIPTGFSIGTDIVSIEKSVKLLEIHLGNRLNFNLHVHTICKSASNQLNALVRLEGKLEIYKNMPFDFSRMSITALMKHCYTNLEKQL